MQTEDTQSQTRAPVSRRAFLALSGGATVAFGLYLFVDRAESKPIAPDAALARVTNNTLILVDIRRPDEWALTGVAIGAVPLDMRDDTFLANLQRLTKDNPTTPIALICARGVRSRRLAAKLALAGYSDVLDVSEGMLGSAAGPGWIARGLPVAPHKSGANE